MPEDETPPTSLAHITAVTLPRSQLDAAETLRTAIASRDAAACHAAALAYCAVSPRGWDHDSVPREEWIQAALDLDEHEAFAIDPPDARRWILDTALWWILGMQWFGLGAIATVAAHNPRLTWPAASAKVPAVARALDKRRAPGPFDERSNDALTLLAATSGHWTRKLHYPAGLARQLAWPGPRLAAALHELASADLAEIPATVWSAALELPAEDLKGMCETAKLATNGSKGDLIDRLWAAGMGDRFRGKVDHMYPAQVAIGVRKARQLAAVGARWEELFYSHAGDDAAFEEPEYPEIEEARAENTRLRAARPALPGARFTLQADDLGLSSEWATSLFTLGDGSLLIDNHDELIVINLVDDGVSATPGWRHPIRPGEHLTALLMVEDTIVFLDRRGLGCLDAATGEQRWHWSHAGDHGGPLQWNPRVDDGVIVQACDHGVHGIDARTGEARWFANARSPRQPAAGGGHVAAVTGTRTILLLDAISGHERWAIPSKDQLAEDTEPLLTNDRLLINQRSGGIAAIELVTGSITWKAGGKRDRLRKRLLLDGALALWTSGYASCVEPDGSVRWRVGGSLAVNDHGIIRLGNDKIALLDATTGTSGVWVSASADPMNVAPAPNTTAWTQNTSGIGLLDLAPN